MTLINLLLLVIGFLAAITAIGGETWNADANSANLIWYKRVTSFGWLAVMCVFLTFCLGVAKEILMQQASASLEAENKKLSDQVAAVPKVENAHVLMSDKGLERQEGIREFTVRSAMSGKPISFDGGEFVRCDIFNVADLGSLEYAVIEIGPYRFSMIDPNPGDGLFHRGDPTRPIRRDFVQFVVPQQNVASELKFRFLVDKPRANWEFGALIESRSAN